MGDDPFGREPQAAAGRGEESRGSRRTAKRLVEGTGRVWCKGFLPVQQKGGCSSRGGMAEADGLWEG